MQALDTEPGLQRTRVKKSFPSGSRRATEKSPSFFNASVCLAQVRQPASSPIEGKKATLRRKRGKSREKGDSAIRRRGEEERRSGYVEGEGVGASGFSWRVFVGGVAFEKSLRYR